MGGLTVDHIVLPDGSSHRHVLGGNAYYSALGAHLWTDDVRIISFVGTDFDSESLDHLHEVGIDISLVARLEGPSIHLWILYEADGRRQIHYQHRSSHLSLLEGAVAAALPSFESIRMAQPSLHIAALPAALQTAILTALGPLAEQVTLDSIEARGSVGGDLFSYRAENGFDHVVAFLPSREEMDVVRGETSEADFAYSMTWPNLRFVIVKDGAKGCTVYDSREKIAHRIPAWPSHVVDPTGAGDAFCGGFMVGLATLSDPVEAAILGSVSASFAVEGIGGSHLLSIDASERSDRRNALRRVAVRAAN